MFPLLAGYSTQESGILPEQHRRAGPGNMAVVEPANTGCKHRRADTVPSYAALGRAGPTPRLSSTVELWYWYWCREASPRK